MNNLSIQQDPIGGEQGGGEQGERPITEDLTRLAVSILDAHNVPTVTGEDGAQVRQLDHPTKPDASLKRSEDSEGNVTFSFSYPVTVLSLRGDGDGVETITWVEGSSEMRMDQVVKGGGHRIARFSDPQFADRQSMRLKDLFPQSKETEADKPNPRASLPEKLLGRFAVRKRGSR